MVILAVAKVSGEMKSGGKGGQNMDFKNEIQPRQGPKWLVFGGLVLGIAAFALVEIRLGCLFRELTGWHCPGCGMTRAVQAVIQGEMAKAFRFNPLGMILLPLIGLGIGMEMLGWMRRKPLPFRLKLGVRGVGGIAGMILLFWILRNLPWWPFCLLAPS
jgi:Protein of unknown function (DUF2752)